MKSPAGAAAAAPPSPPSTTPQTPLPWGKLAILSLVTLLNTAS
jgi:MFS family permease